MRMLIFLMMSLFAIQISGCSDADKPTSHASEQQTNNGGNALIISEKPNLSIVDVDDDYYVLRISDKRKNRVEFRVHKEGGKLPEIADSFFINYCGKKALIITLQADADTGITAGSTYDNWVLDRATGKVIDVIGAGEVSDRITGEVISDSQKAIIAKLKSGIQSAGECK